MSCNRFGRNPIYGLISAPIGMKVFLLAWIILVVLYNAFVSDKSTKIALSLSQGKIHGGLHIENLLEYCNNNNYFCKELVV